MNTTWLKFVKTVEVRKVRERYVLLGVMLLVVLYVWFMLAQDIVQRKLTEVGDSIDSANSQIQAQAVEQDAMRASHSADPNSQARIRQRELQAANVEMDNKLDELYGQLIDPQEMAVMLARILQRDTTLQLVDLQNLPSASILTSSVQRDAQQPGSEPVNVEVFRHGLRMEFDGSFVETVRYLRSLEEFKNSFFWERLELKVVEHPTAHITLEIYTLSTERGWIGV
jgi:MSHA biogenesis protein MshJ